MNLKLIALAACAGYGLWYLAVGGKRITPENVATLYQDYASAYDRGDSKAVCDLFRDDYRGKFSSTSRTMPVKESVDKTDACASVGEFYGPKKKLEELAGQMLYTNIEYTLNLSRSLRTKNQHAPEC